MFKIFKDENKEEKQKDVFLKLEDDGDRIDLVAVDKYGDRISRGAILCIDNCGTLFKYTNVSDEIGLCLNGSEIKVRKK
jgi:hypothetical protein